MVACYFTWPLEKLAKLLELLLTNKYISLKSMVTVSLVLKTLIPIKVSCGKNKISVLASCTEV